MLKERQLCQVWQQKRLPAPLTTEDGLEFQVVYPGRYTFDRGPDFRDAILALPNGELIRGDIEVHIHSSDWESHLHHRDPYYNRVILHVVAQHNSAATIRLDGNLVPVFVLEPDPSLDDSSESLRDDESSLYNGPCRAYFQSAGWETFHRLLADAGDERLSAKAAFFEGEMNASEPAQALYEGLMEALGYRQNRAQFKELAHRTPLAILETLAIGRTKDVQTLLLEACLFGAAGLLPSQRSNRLVLSEDAVKYAEGLQSCWDMLSSRWNFQPMETASWNFYRVRPENFPPRRIAGAALLLADCLTDGLIVRLVRKPLDQQDGIRRCVIRSLKTEVGPFWANRYDFDKGPIAASSSLIGQGRMYDIVINIILPFAVAYGRLTHHQRLVDKAWGLYREFPRLATNEYIRHIHNEFCTLPERLLAPKARHQQGLLHLYHLWHRDRRCYECPLSGNL